VFIIISLLLFIDSYYFYYLSLENCLDGQDKCCKKWKWIFRKIKQLIISIILLIFLFFLIIYGMLSKLHLIHFTMTFIFFYNYSHSSYFHDHGAFNLIGLFASLLESLIILLITKLFLAIFKIKYKYKIFSGMILIVFYTFLNDPMNCND